MTSDEMILRELFSAALAAAQPAGKFDTCLPLPAKGRTIVIGAGKASAQMAAAFEDAWLAAGHARPEGLVVTRYGHSVPTRYVKVVEAAHPIPDDASEQASRHILEIARSAGPDDLVVCLISGGASALLCMPAPGLTLSDKQRLNHELLRSGASIGAMNQVRKALSAVKGGRLAAAAYPARLVTYLISDVPGDNVGTIGSGPTIFEHSDPEQVLDLLRAYEITLTDAMACAIKQNTNAVQPVDAVVHVLATPRMALEAAAARARALGISPLILSDAIEGEAREVAKVHAAIARSTRDHGDPIQGPCVILSGGETTVTMKGNGRGGRNSEFLLALALALGDSNGIAAIAGDTDGIDGSEKNAGAWIDADFMRLASDMGIELSQYLEQNDAYSVFEATERLVVTGPTYTNVNDFRAILIKK